MRFCLHPVRGGAAASFVTVRMMTRGVLAVGASGTAQAGRAALQIFFHIRATVINDETGDHLTDAEEAMARAAVIAQELADDAGQWRDLSVEVVDEHGTEVGRVPISG